jgi:hypothetical protein
VSTLEITLDAETKQRVEVVAAEKNVSVNDYVMAAVQRQLANDEPITDRAQMAQDEAIQLVKDMRALRESILAERNGELIDVNAILDLVRDGQDAEPYNLR